MTEPTSSGVTIRPIRSSDWPDIERIQQECFSETVIESRAVLQSIVALSPESCLAAEDGPVLGYLLAYPWFPDDLPPLQAGLTQLPPDPRGFFIHDVAVSPAGRGRRIARLLVESVLTWAHGRGLRHGSLISVQNSQEFWRRFGFSERADLTARFHVPVTAHYRVPFAFMTADFPSAAD